MTTKGHAVTCTCPISIASGIITDMPDSSPHTMPDKVTENRIRRMASRQGLKLEKSRRRDPHALGYATFRLRREDETLAAGREDRGEDYGLSIEQVEAWLTGDRS